MQALHLSFHIFSQILTTLEYKNKKHYFYCDFSIILSQQDGLFPRKKMVQRSFNASSFLLFSQNWIIQETAQYASQFFIACKKI